jgi:hypothetical protein
LKIDRDSEVLFIWSIYLWTIIITTNKYLRQKQIKRLVQWFMPLWYGLRCLQSTTETVMNEY